MEKIKKSNRAKSNVPFQKEPENIAKTSLKYNLRLSSEQVQHNTDKDEMSPEKIKLAANPIKKKQNPLKKSKQKVQPNGSNQKKYAIPNKQIKNTYSVNIYGANNGKSNITRLSKDILTFEKVKLSALFPNIEASNKKYVAVELKYAQFGNNDIKEQFNLIQSLNFIAQETLQDNQKNLLLSFLLEDDTEIYFMLNAKYLFSVSNKTFFDIFHQYLYTSIKAEKTFYNNKLYKSGVKFVKPKLMKRTCDCLGPTTEKIEDIIKDLQEEFKNMGNSVETLEFSFELITLAYKENAAFIIRLISLINENSNLNKVKQIYIEFIFKVLQPEKIKEFNQYLNENKSEFTSLLQGKSIFLRFTLYNNEKHRITSFIEKRLHIDKVIDNYYPLLYSKFSKTSALQKFHKFILMKIFPYIMDLSTYILEDTDIKIIHTLTKEENSKKKTK